MRIQSHCLIIIIIILPPCHPIHINIAVLPILLISIIRFIIAEFINQKLMILNRGAVVCGLEGFEWGAPMVMIILGNSIEKYGKEKQQLSESHRRGDQSEGGVDCRVS